MLFVSNITCLQRQNVLRGTGLLILIYYYYLIGDAFHSQIKMQINNSSDPFIADELYWELR